MAQQKQNSQLRLLELVLGFKLFNRRCGSSATATINQSEKFCLVVFLVLIQSCWMHSSTLFEFG